MSQRNANGVFEAQYDKATTMDGVDPAVAALMVVSGGPDDVVQMGVYSGPARKLKPSQTTMVLAKSLGSAVKMLRKGKGAGGKPADLGAMISSDKFIMDGHHRWSAVILARGKDAQVTGLQASLPGEELLRVLNLISKGSFGFTRGNPGSGSIMDYTPRIIEKALKAALKSGITGEKPATPEQVAEALEIGFGSVKKGIVGMADNSRYMVKTTPSWAPDRSQMPIIPKEQVWEAASLLSKGSVDWAPPYKMSSLRAATIRLAHRQPHLRPYLLPLLTR